MTMLSSRCGRSTNTGGAETAESVLPAEEGYEKKARLHSNCMSSPAKMQVND